MGLYIQILLSGQVCLFNYACARECTCSPHTCVYLNCCSTSLMTVRQSRQRNVPLISSGCTGWVRTTWPVMRSSVPILAVVSSRTLKNISIFYQSWRQNQSSPTSLWTWSSEQALKLWPRSGFMSTMRFFFNLLTSSLTKTPKWICVDHEIQKNIC